MQLKKLHLTIFLVSLVLVTSIVYQQIPTLRQKIAGLKTEETSGLIQGIIIPHHLLAKELIVDSIGKIENKETYELVVLIGPNHFHPDTNTFTTTTTLEEEFNLATNEIQALIEKFPDIRDDQDLIQNEHSIMEILPFVVTSFSNAKIIPLSISVHFDQDYFDRVIAALHDLTQRKTMAIASVDFSHNTQRLEALQKNEESIKAIQDYEFETLYSFKDDHLDSPLAMSALLKLMQLKSTTNFEVWYNTHSSIITDNPALQGTSYVIGVFR